MLQLEAETRGEIMKAVRCRAYGDSGVLVYGDADQPVARPVTVSLGSLSWTEMI